MYEVIMQARLLIAVRDRVTYNPPFADPYRGERATVTGFAEDDKDPKNPYWAKVVFDKDIRAGRKETTIALRHCIRERR